MCYRPNSQGELIISVFFISQIKYKNYNKYNSETGLLTALINGK